MPLLFTVWRRGTVNRQQCFYHPCSSDSSRFERLGVPLAEIENGGTTIRHDGGGRLCSMFSCLNIIGSHAAGESSPVRVISRPGYLQILEGLVVGMI